MNFSSRAYIVFPAFSGVLVLLSIGAVAAWGLPLGIDFAGGSLLEIEFSPERLSSEAIRETLQSFGLSNAAIQETGERGVIIRSGYMDEEIHQTVLARLRERVRADGVKESVITEKRFDTIGPALGKELRNRAVLALFVSALAIIAYIAWAFRNVSRPVASWKYGVVAVLALLHDVIIPVGVFAALGRFYGIEADALFVTALLAVMGFSVHDTIVVFDRIRENLRLSGQETLFERVVGESVRQVIGRSLSTSFAVLLALSAILFFGGASTRLFSLALFIGIFFGTYSSLFLASPLLVAWERITRS